MRKKAHVYVAFALIILLVGCNISEQRKKAYENQIGDTRFNPKIDNPNFKFCDTANVLHKRARVQYRGGNPNLEKEIINGVKFQEDYSAINGYCIVRFAVNCEDETGRFRLETLDNNFDKLKFPMKLEATILSTVKNLTGWKHPMYKGKAHDGYNFFILKITDGKISLP